MIRLAATITALACATSWAEPPPAPPSSSPRTLELEAANAWAPGSDAPTLVGPGCYLRADVCQSTGRELAELRTANATLEREPEKSSPSAVVWIVVISLALGGGYAAGRLIK